MYTEILFLWLFPSLRPFEAHPFITLTPGTAALVKKQGGES